MLHDAAAGLIHVQPAGPMVDERITFYEMLAAIRRAGHGSLARVRLITLETDGSLSMVMAAPRSWVHV